MSIRRCRYCIWCLYTYVCLSTMMMAIYASVFILLARCVQQLFSLTTLKTTRHFFVSKQHIPFFCINFYIILFDHNLVSHLTYVEAFYIGQDECAHIYQCAIFRILTSRFSIAKLKPYAGEWWLQLHYCKNVYRGILLIHIIEMFKNMCVCFVFHMRKHW